jgi:mRNA-degrading endonuclease toxin of MazEF toxin-antitoxin module
VEWQQKTIDVLTGPLPVAGVLGRICLVLWSEVKSLQKEAKAKDVHIQALNDARIADLKAMVRPDD